MSEKILPGQEPMTWYRKLLLLHQLFPHFKAKILDVNIHETSTRPTNPHFVTGRQLLCSSLFRITQPRPQDFLRENPWGRGYLEEKP